MSVVLALSGLAQTVADEAVGSGAAEFWAFWIFAPICLGSALAVVLMRNAVHAALMLVVNLLTLAVFFAILEAQFLAAVQIIVYAGAIVVLFLFVLMLLGVSRDRPTVGPVRGHRTAGVLLGLALLVALSGAVVAPYLGEASVCPPAEAPADAVGEPCVGLAAANAEGNVRGVGLLLFTDYVWPFEVMSVLLVVAAIGAVVLGRLREDPADLVDRAPRPTPTPEASAEAPPGGEQP